MDLYKSSKPAAKRWYEQYKDKVKPEDTINRVVGLTGAPCVVVGYWLYEFSNWDPYFIGFIERMMAFYGYEAVANKPDIPVI